MFRNFRDSAALTPSGLGSHGMPAPSAHGLSFFILSRHFFAPPEGPKFIIGAFLLTFQKAVLRSRALGGGRGVGCVG